MLSMQTFLVRSLQRYSAGAGGAYFGTVECKARARIDWDSPGIRCLVYLLASV